MFSYIKGVITEVNSIYVVIENGGIGYQVLVSNPKKYKLNEDTIIYIYSHIKEDENTLYGFKSTDEKNMFLKLISVKGLGPKVTLPMFASGSIDGIINAIERENTLYLKKFPRIGDKLAKQIILDLKGKFKSENLSLNYSLLEELIETLKSLGYKMQDINKILPKINAEEKLEIQLKESLKLLLKK